MVDSPNSHKKYTKPPSAAGDGMSDIFMKDQSFYLKIQVEWPLTYTTLEPL